MQPHPILSERYRSAEEKPAYLQKLFDAGAPYYDGVINWGSFGTGKWYRRSAQRRAGIGPGSRILDAAAGTGVMADAALGLGVSPQDIVCLDPSPGMLAVAKRKLDVETVVAGADAIPLEDERFDFVMMGYALRHVLSLEGAFREYWRVLRPGGRVLILEITKPARGLGAQMFRFWFRDIYPAVTRLFTRSASAQDMMLYYWETMDVAVPPESILQALSAVGFENPRRHVVGGIFSEYTATKPVRAGG